MAKLINKGFTDYFGVTIPIDILAHDGNKYATIRMPDGKVDTIKRGYITRDYSGKRSIPEINWWILSEEKRKDFKSRVKCTGYVVYHVDRFNDQTDFKNKKDAVAWSVAAAIRTGKTIEITNTVQKSRRTTIMGHVTIDCTPDGLAIQYGGDGGRKRSETPKYLRGYGRR